ncbi:MAG: hypothetical protein KKE55_01435, partial [Candidatus Omnitrophica bacterium]|nr:hypothetical protein [Candidatus Omnitrophota bacterium]
MSNLQIKPEVPLSFITRLPLAMIESMEVGVKFMEVEQSGVEGVFCDFKTVEGLYSGVAREGPYLELGVGIGSDEYIPYDFEEVSSPIEGDSPQIKIYSGITMPYGYLNITPERLLLNRGTCVVAFKILGTFGRESCLNLAEEEESGKLFTIRELQSEKEEEHCGFIPKMRALLPFGLEGVYQPQWMSAGKNMWAGLEDASAIVYPFIEGKDFGHFFAQYKGQPLSSYAVKLFDSVLKVTKTCALLEERKVPGVWDIRADNIIITTKEDDTVLIDYTKMNVDPIYSLEFLLYEPFEQIAHTGIENLLPSLKFSLVPVLNKEIIAALGDLHYKVKAARYSSIMEFCRDLEEIEKLFSIYSSSPAAAECTNDSKGKVQKVRITGQMIFERLNGVEFVGKDGIIYKININVEELVNKKEIVTIWVSSDEASQVFTPDEHSYIEAIVSQVEEKNKIDILIDRDSIKETSRGILTGILSNLNKLTRNYVFNVIVLGLAVYIFLMLGLFPEKIISGKVNGYLNIWLEAIKATIFSWEVVWKTVLGYFIFGLLTDSLVKRVNREEYSLKAFWGVAKYTAYKAAIVTLFFIAISPFNKFVRGAISGFFLGFILLTLRSKTFYSKRQDKNSEVAKKQRKDEMFWLTRSWIFGQNFIVQVLFPIESRSLANVIISQLHSLYNSYGLHEQRNSLINIKRKHWITAIEKLFRSRHIALVAYGFIAPFIMLIDVLCLNRSAKKISTGNSSKISERRIIKDKPSSSPVGEEKTGTSLIFQEKDIGEITNKLIKQFSVLSDEELAEKNLKDTFKFIDEYAVLEQEQKDDLVNLLEGLSKQAMKYFEDDNENPIYHHTQVLYNMVRLALGELDFDSDSAYTELKNLLLLALLHDVGNSKCEHTKVVNKEIIDALESAKKESSRKKKSELIQEAATLAKEGMAFRLEHMDKAPPLIFELTAPYIKEGIIGEEDLHFITRAVVIHDYPSIEKNLDELREADVSVKYERGTFLFPFNDPAIGRLITFLREADRLFMLSVQGVIKDVKSYNKRLRRKGKKEKPINSITIIERANKNIKSHKKEYELYQKTGKDDNRFIRNESLYRTKTGYDIFKRAEERFNQFFGGSSSSLCSLENLHRVAGVQEAIRYGWSLTEIGKFMQLLERYECVLAKKLSLPLEYVKFSEVRFVEEGEENNQLGTSFGKNLMVMLLGTTLIRELFFVLFTVPFRLLKAVIKSIFSSGEEREIERQTLPPAKDKQISSSPAQLVNFELSDVSLEFPKDTISSSPAVDSVVAPLYLKYNFSFNEQKKEAFLEAIYLKELLKYLLIFYSDEEAKQLFWEFSAKDIVVQLEKWVKSLLGKKQVKEILNND